MMMANASQFMLPSNAGQHDVPEDAPPCDMAHCPYRVDGQYRLNIGGIEQIFCSPQHLALARQIVGLPAEDEKEPQI